MLDVYDVLSRREPRSMREDLVTLYRVALERYGSVLDYREREVFSRFLGLRGQPESWEVIGRAFGVSRNRARDVFIRARAKLRRELVRRLWEECREHL